MRGSAGKRFDVARVLATALCLSVPLQAQAETESQSQGSAGGDAVGSEIIVTAQFRSQSLQDTPIAITAVSGEMLEARSQTDLAQVAQQAPNVTLTSAGQSFGNSLIASIRGVGQRDFNPALEPGVGIYVDDVYYATLTGSIMDLLDLDRVEILRGPQGTLSGRNSIGGAIKMFSKRPEGDNSGSVALTYGIRDRIDLRGSADIGISDDVAARLSAVSKRQKGYVERKDFGCVYPAGQFPTINPIGGVPRSKELNSDCVLAREGETDLSAVRGQLRIQPTSKIDINIIGDYTYEDRNATPNVIVPILDANGNYLSPRVQPTGDINPYPVPIALDERFVCGLYCNYSTFNHEADGAFAKFATNGRFDFEGWGLSGQVDLELADNLSLSSITAYRTYNSQFSNDSDLSPLAQHLGLSILDFEFFSQELRLSGSIGTNDLIQYTLGGYYSDQESIYTARQDFRESLGAFYQRDPVPAESKALFAHVAVNLTPDLTFNGGLRYTDESKSYTFVRLTPEGEPHPTLRALNGASGSYATKEWDYRANLQYRWADNIMTYAQVATGYKGGGINPRPFFAPQARPFGPEKLTSYELGMKTDWFGRALRINAAAFLSKYNGIQLTLGQCPGLGVPATPCAQPANAGNADMQGFEIEATLNLFDGLLLDASVSHLDFDYTWLNPDAGGPTRITGPQYTDKAPYTPDWKWSAGLQYKVDLGSSGSVTPRFDIAYQSKMYTGPRANAYNGVEGYALANARLTWRNFADDFEIAAEVTNLFDKYYFRTFVADGVNPTFVTGQPGRPREWAVTLKKRF